MRNKHLHRAKKARNDEFYTQYSDIENELRHYEKHFKGKVVYCNCDSEDSAFWHFFVDKFKAWGLKKIIATHYEQGEGAHSYVLELCANAYNETHTDRLSQTGGQHEYNRKTRLRLFPSMQYSHAVFMPNPAQTLGGSTPNRMEISPQPHFCLNPKPCRVSIFHALSRMSVYSSFSDASPFWDGLPARLRRSTRPYWRHHVFSAAALPPD